MSILIVDDDGDIRTVLSLRLRAEGFNTEAVNSAQVAYARLNSTKNIDLILLDVLMPEESGIAACRKIKEDSRTEDIPIIMMTASEDIVHLKDAFDAGAMDYLTKPFNKSELLLRIRSALRLKHVIDRLKSHQRELVTITERLKFANIRLEALSATDELTGVFNRRHFDLTLANEHRRAQRLRSRIALIMVDVDRFKDFNDRYGHQTGDKCLTAVAHELVSATNRSHDLVARYGGEEFAIILPDATEAGAGTLAETIRHRVAGLKFTGAYSTSSDILSVTISVGVVSKIPDSHSVPEALICEADKALYQSKMQGRNCVTVFAQDE